MLILSRLCGGAAGAGGRELETKRSCREHWTCESCTFLNDGECDLCEACNGPRVTPGGTGQPCMHASVTVQGSARMDMVSSASDGLHAGGEQQGSGPWQCRHCTFLNDAGASSCEMCHKTQGLAPRTSGDVLEVRACFCSAQDTRLGQCQSPAWSSA